jgi:DNA helicase HerA-like ATPase
LSLSDQSALWKALFARTLIDHVSGLARTRYIYSFLVLDEAQLYVREQDVLELISTIRHIGVNTLFITNNIASIPEQVIRAADYRIFLRLSNDHDIKHIARNSPIDEDTIASFVKNLAPHQALIVGKPSNDYPVMVSVRDIEGAGGVTRRHFADVEMTVVDGKLQFRKKRSGGRNQVAFNGREPIAKSGKEKER